MAEGMWIIGYGSLIFKPPPLYSFRVTGTLKGFVRRFWQSSSDHRGTPEAPGRVATLVSLADLKSHLRFHDDLYMYELGGRHKETDLASASLADLTIHSVPEKVSALSEEDLQVWGVAYYIAPEHADEMKEYLDVREQDGYSTHKVHFHVHSVDHSSEAAAALSSAHTDDSGNIVLESMIYIGTIDNESFVGPEDINQTANTIRSSVGPSGPNIEYLLRLTLSVRELDPQNRSRDYYLEDLLALAETEHS